MVDRARGWGGWGGWEGWEQWSGCFRRGVPGWCCLGSGHGLAALRCLNGAVSGRRCSLRRAGRRCSLAGVGRWPVTRVRRRRHTVWVRWRSHLTRICRRRHLNRVGRRPLARVWRRHRLVGAGRRHFLTRVRRRRSRRRRHRRIWRRHLRRERRRPLCLGAALVGHGVCLLIPRSCPSARRQPMRSATGSSTIAAVKPAMLMRSHPYLPATIRLFSASADRSAGAGARSVWRSASRSAAGP